MPALILALTGCAALAETGETSGQEAVEYALKLINMDQEFGPQFRFPDCGFFLLKQIRYFRDDAHFTER